MLKIIEFGATKNNRQPRKPIRKLSNHPRLHETPEEVWKTLSEQLFESAVTPYDFGGAVTDDAPTGSLSQGVDDVERLPKGVFPIRWVEKTDSERVCICINMRVVNRELKEDSGKVDLTALSKMSAL